MNVRMIELYKEASEFAYKICQAEGRAGGTSDHIWNTLSTGKFAELIVRECANIDFRHKIGLTGDQSCEVSSLIEKHFGI